MRIWLVAHEHSCGIDFTSYENEMQARYGAAAQAVRKAQRTCPSNVRCQIQDLFERGLDVEVLRLYGGHVYYESFKVFEVEHTHGVSFHMSIVEVDTEIVHATRSTPRGDVTHGRTWCKRSFWWVSQRAPLPEGPEDFRARLSEEPRHITCIGCVVAERPDLRRYT